MSERPNTPVLDSHPWTLAISIRDFYRPMIDDKQMVFDELAELAGLKRRGDSEDQWTAEEIRALVPNEKLRERLVYLLREIDEMEMTVIAAMHERSALVAWKEEEEARHAKATQ